MTERRDTDEKPQSKTRITCQFRDKRRMVYELDCAGEVLSVTMAEQEDAGQPWQAGAGLGRTDAGTAIYAQGESRSAALEAVASEWERREPATHPTLDWAAIRAALAAVRAV